MLQEEPLFLHMTQMHPKQLQGPQQMTMMLKKNLLMMEAMMRTLGLATLEKMKATNKMTKNEKDSDVDAIMIAES